MIGSTLSRYEITAKLGQGGMGEVWRATDAALNREVAIKVLPAEMAADPERLERFKREAQAIAALNHPNIVTIHSVEETEGLHLLTMELVEGQSLDQMLPPSGFDLERLFALAIQIADALTSAHEKGIVHRDLKPANVMVTGDGRVKVLDFGLAKLAEQPEEAEETQLMTQAGMVLGTVPYMSPEQVQAGPVDQRSDIFSLGILLYEMTTGERPFRGDNSASVISAVLKDQPPPVSEIRTALPNHLGRIIQRCLEKDPERRYQSAKDVRYEFEALREEVQRGKAVSGGLPSERRPSAAATPSEDMPPRPDSVTLTIGKKRLWPAAAVAVVAVVALGWWLRRDSQGPGAAASDQKISSIAVLPFVNESGDDEMNFLGDGIAESVINSLAQLPDLRVAPRSTAFRYRGRDAELEAIAAELDVRGVVTGRVSRRGDRLVVGAELTDAASVSQVWGERYDTSIDEILRVEEQIAREITDALKISLSGEQAEQLDRRHTDVPAAHLAYMEAKHAWGTRSTEGFRRSLELYDRAIAADPGFALAYASKAETYVLMMLYMGRVADYEAPLRAAVETALSLRPNLAEAYPVQGFLHILERKWDEADRAIQKAIELQPNYATAYHWYSAYLGATGNNRGRLPMSEKARQLDPGSLVIATDYAIALEHAGRPQEAEAMLLELIETAPGFWRGPDTLGKIYLRRGRNREAVPWLQRGCELAGEIAWCDGSVGAAQALAGDREAALEELRRLEQRAVTEYVSPLGFARLHAGLGDMEQAFEWIAKALAENDPLLVIGSAVWVPALVEDPRWREIEEKLGYPAERQ